MTGLSREVTWIQVSCVKNTRRGEKRWGRRHGGGDGCEMESLPRAGKTQYQSEKIVKEHTVSSIIWTMGALAGGI